MDEKAAPHHVELSKPSATANSVEAEDTEPALDSDDLDFPSDSDSDPMLTNGATNAQTTSCWSGLISMFTSCCATARQSIEIDGRQYRIQRLLAEGGFSFVYLARHNSGDYAVKKMIVQTKEQSAAAKHELAVLEELRGGDFILPLLGSATRRHAKIPEFLEVYMAFPFVAQGNLVSVLQALYDRNVAFMEERRLLRIFSKVCKGLLCLHNHAPAWAHRDIKLDNILLGAQDTPLLMDFGSVSEAKVQIRSRAEAVKMQEWAQKNMSGPYTAPEFFNCPSRFKFDERTDVWALGCLLYAMCFGRSPFDNEQDGGSAALAVLSKVEYPQQHPYSQGLMDLIAWMLKPKLKLRPFVPAIIQRVGDMLNDTKQARD